MKKISLVTARKLALAGQGLDGGWKLPRGKEGVARAIERLGYVQIDTIAVVQRAHHHTLWTRRGDYTPDMLHDLHANDRRVFEYWSHAASFLPMRDYRWSIPRMKAWANDRRTLWFRQKNAEVIKHVIARIRAEGPLGSADFAAPEGRKRGSWWDWKPAKQALETLLGTGELMVTERRNFQRLYDLTERVLPPGVDTTEPTRDELARFAVRWRLARDGVSAFRQWAIRDRQAIEQALVELAGAGEVTEVHIDGLNGKPHYCLTKDLAAATRRSRRRKRLHILSPFDSLVIWRGPLKKLFGFDYKLECYTPAANRRYVCLPILWGNEFIGRLDPQADRRAKTLIVRDLIFEAGFTDHDAALPALADRLREFAAFNGCDEVTIDQMRPRQARAVLKRELKK